MSASIDPAHYLLIARTPLEASTARADLDMWAMGLNVGRSEINMIQMALIMTVLRTKRRMRSFLRATDCKGAAFALTMGLNTGRGRRSSQAGDATSAGAPTGRSGVKRSCARRRAQVVNQSQVLVVAVLTSSALREPSLELVCSRERRKGLTQWCRMFET